MIRPAACLLLAAALALGGCGSEPKKDTAAGTAAGEVLPGSASDAMLPYDSVKSQAPLAPKAESTAKAAGKTAAKAGSTEDKAPAESPDESAPPADPPAEE